MPFSQQHLLTLCLCVTDNSHRIDNCHRISNVFITVIFNMMMLGKTEGRRRRRQTEDEMVEWLH